MPTASSLDGIPVTHTPQEVGLRSIAKHEPVFKPASDPASKHDDVDEESPFMFLTGGSTGQVICLDTREQSQVEVNLGQAIPALEFQMSTQDQRYWSRFRERHNGTDVEYYFVDDVDEHKPVFELGHKRKQSD